MNYAIVEDGTVVNVIWLLPANAAEFPGAVPLNGIPAGIGDTWDGTDFYRGRGEAAHPGAAGGEERAGHARGARAAGRDGGKRGAAVMGRYLEAAKVVRAAMDAAAAVLTDEQALRAVALYPAWDGAAQYGAGDRVRYGGALYRCLQAHAAQSGWTPTAAPSLWAKVLVKRHRRAPALGAAGEHQPLHEGRQGHPRRQDLGEHHRQQRLGARRLRLGGNGRMISLEAFLRGVAKIKSKAPTYREGGDGSDGTCDCIGLVIGAIRRAGGGWAGTHGSNYAARFAVDGLFRQVDAADLEPGWLVFKALGPMDAGYDLPDRVPARWS